MRVAIPDRDGWNVSRFSGASRASDCSVRSVTTSGKPHTYASAACSARVARAVVEGAAIAVADAGDVESGGLEPRAGEDAGDEHAAPATSNTATNRDLTFMGRSVGFTRCRG